MFYGKYKILLILAFLFMLGLTAVVFISFTEAFSIGNAEPYAVAHFMEKALDAGMDGSGIGLIAIPKTILLLIPSVVYRFTEETILLLVAAGTSFYRHPIRLVLLLIILIAVAIFLYLVFIFIAGILDIRKAEKKEAKEYDI